LSTNINKILLSLYMNKHLQHFQKPKNKTIQHQQEPINRESTHFKRGKYSYGNPTIHNETEATLTIGNFCSIAYGVNIYLGGNHNTNWVTTYPFGHIHQNIFKTFNGIGHPSTKGDVTIGNDVWIGAHVTIMSGVTIRDGAVIANNSHVVKDVDPYCIAGGNPARIVKQRFKEKQIEDLLEIQWWNWDDEKIDAFSPLLCDENIDAFIEKAKQ
jgi:acetyltransferase-like isoleucine patch superfamily enzyme